MQTLKDKIISKMREMGANVDNFKFKFYAQSPYQKKRFKPEFVEAECWIYPKNKKEGYILTDEGFNNPEYCTPYLEMIILENA